MCGRKKPAFEKAAQLVTIFLFGCFWAAEVLLFALFSVEEVGADCRQRESAGNDIVRELMGIA